MISKVERSVSTPTATLLGKIAAGLDVGLSHLLGEMVDRAPVLTPPEAQPVYRDPETGFQRRSLSPLFPDRKIDFALNDLPAGQAAVFPPHRRGVEEYLYVVEGALTVVVEGTRYEVGAGASLFYHAHVVHEFRNETGARAVFFVVVDGGAAT
jgi:mannose-6-phosphate isomerase-like protein (cupin superfamily)